MLAFPDDGEAKVFESSHAPRLGRIRWELRHGSYWVTPASATNASRTGESSANASCPKVSM